MSDENIADSNSSVPLKYDFGGMPALLATHFTVTRVGPGQYVLGLHEAQLPLLIGTPEEQLAQRKKVTEIQALPLGRFIVSGDFLRSVIKILSDFTFDEIIPVERNSVEKAENESTEQQQ